MQKQWRNNQETIMQQWGSVSVPPQGIYIAVTLSSFLRIKALHPGGGWAKESWNATHYLKTTIWRKSTHSGRYGRLDPLPTWILVINFPFLPFHTVHGVLKERILKWFAIPFFKWFFFSFAPKSLQMVTAAMKLKDTYPLEEKLWPTRTAY